MSRGRRSNKLSFKCPAHESRGPARAAATLGLEPGTCHVATYTGFRGSPGGVRALCWNQEKPLSNSEWAPPPPPAGRLWSVAERPGPGGEFAGARFSRVWGSRALPREFRKTRRPWETGEEEGPTVRGPSSGSRPPGGTDHRVGASERGSGGWGVSPWGVGGSARSPWPWGVPVPGRPSPSQTRTGCQGRGPLLSPELSCSATPAWDPPGGRVIPGDRKAVCKGPRAKGRVQRAAFARHLWSLAVDGQFPQRCCWKLLGAFRGGTEPVSGGQAADEARPASFPWGPRGTRERPQRLLRPTEAEASLRSFFWDVDALHDLLRPPHAHVGRHRPRSQGQQGGQRARGGRGPRQLGLLFWEKERRDSPRGRPAPHSACGGPRGPSEPRAGTGCGR